MCDDLDVIELRILATSDVHTHLTDYNYYRDIPVEKYGLSSLALLVNKARKEKANTLLVDNGDMLQGSPMGDYMLKYAEEKEHPAYKIMNAMDYDAATLGNHEFNFGIDFITKMLPQADFPYVNANIKRSSGESWLMPYVIIEKECVSQQGKRHHLKIGIIGLLPPQVRQWDKQHFDEYGQTEASLMIEDAKSSLRSYLPTMKAEGADVIMVLSHSGYSTLPYTVGDENFSNHLVDLDGVDAIIAGHQHRRFPSPDFIDWFDDGFNCEKGTIQGIPSVMPGFWAKYLGQIDLVLAHKEGKWQRVEGTAKLRDMNEFGHVEAEPILNATLQDAHDYLREKMISPVAQSSTDYFSYLSLIQDDYCIQVVCDAQYYYANKILKDYPELATMPLLSAAPLFKVGGRKDDPSYFTAIPKGNMAFKDVADLYIYPNQLVILKISGMHLKEWLECSASIYTTIDPNEAKPQSLINWQEYRSYNFDVIKGITYGIDPTSAPRYDSDFKVINPQSERISDLLYNEKKINTEDQFLLVTNSYRALVDRFPGAGVENSVIITMHEIPEVILEFILYEMGTKGMLNTSIDDNWHIDFSKMLRTTRLLLETANHVGTEEYIKREAKYPMTFSHSDAEGFSVYEFSPFQPS